MGFYSGRANGQNSGDLCVVQPLNHQGQRFTLSLYQIEAGGWLLIGGLDQGLRVLV
jgi:hypothetical protein